MPEIYYRDALKRGQKEKKACLSRSEYPYLPALDDFLDENVSARGVNVGICNIPAEFIVGTRTHGRADAFARNWMPLMQAQTEFSTKWEHLSQAHVNEGIRDAIKVYEYMNRYYVEEGNKRVSVLKYFGSVTVAAEVIRILPEKSDDPAVVRYFDYLDFLKTSGVNFVEFSQGGYYAELQRRVGKAPGESWTEEERKRFARVYYDFRRAFRGNDKERSHDQADRVGDALLAYLRLYGYVQLCSLSADAMKKALEKMKAEMELMKEAEPIQVKADPEDTSSTGSGRHLTSLLPAASAKPLKIAFIHDKTPEESGWTMLHEAGRRQVQIMMDGQIETRAYCDAMDVDPDQVIEDAIRDGSKVIFTTSPLLLPATRRKALEHRDIILMNCSLNKAQRYSRSYYARIYEAKFIIGAIAGSISESGRVGYICDYPIYGQIAGINAFAQGVQMVNPNGKVYLEWSSVCGVEEAIRRMEEKHIHMISSQDSARLREWKTANFGLCYVRNGEEKLLATPIWNWSVYYEKLIRMVMNKTIQPKYEEGGKALNYFWGMSADVVGLSYGEALPESAKKLGRFLTQGIRSGICTPFYGPLHMQDGSTIDGEDHRLTLEQIMNMDVLMDNIIGTIPEYEELDAIGRSTVNLVGVEKAVKDLPRVEAAQRTAHEAVHEAVGEALEDTMGKTAEETAGMVARELEEIAKKR